MNNSKCRITEPSDQTSEKNANDVQTELSEPQKQTIIKISSDSKVPIEDDKMAERLSLLKVIITAVEQLELQNGADNSCSISLSYFEKTLQNN